ncbi:putative NRPS-like protein biosynthetic cluster [Cryomyces antarcticus]|uniref:NRPS-like protein biosynthetic cluster n=1 Tax=Cryomyces antarcticus TaxID=329879 RepID=A0ABR0LY76_9PEZI|nr:putative NRPS-like protein biosynthetic cluster [Cryomyces antarcticus]
MNTNYFVCTLGQAAVLKAEHGHRTFANINDFIDYQAEQVPDQPAVGFPKPPSKDASGPWKSSVFSFKDMQRGSLNVAQLLFDQLSRGEHSPVLSERQTFALLCPSSEEFLFTWLALMRLGHSVLLLAPQCQPAAIAHLCKACNVNYLFYDGEYGDGAYEQQAEQAKHLMAADGFENFTITLTPFCRSEDKDIVGCTRRPSGKITSKSPRIEETSVAYLHHTSGTSTGLPKPIPQTHRAAIGVLPGFPNGHERACFTTTPLYHGGIADLFRAWTSGAMIWLFPGREVPITASNIIRCLDVAANDIELRDTAPVKYFSSVPYVLQMMEADNKGLQYLTGMDIVGVGGAALPAEVGDRLVRKRVNLISRFGSAECGFLMSSHREYEKDKEWQYLRSSQGAEALRFEAQPDGTSELVIMKGWPHMAKTNREDGSFATADLFAPHPQIQNAWKYHSRADSQLTLITGKKFDPAPLESAIAASPLLDDVLIFGNGEPFPGALLFRSAESANLSDEALIEKLGASIEELNNGSQDHARIPLRMLHPMPHCETPLEKSSKGTILRGPAEEKYAEEIRKVYEGIGKDVVRDDVSDEGVLQAVERIIGTVVAKKGAKLLGADTDLFSYGVDSVAGMQIRYFLRQLLPKDSNQMPLNVVEDCGNVRRLANFILKQRHGEVYVSDATDEEEHQLMRDTVKEYSAFEEVQNRISTNESVNGHGSGIKRDVVVLTGATGALGVRNLINLALQSPKAEPPKFAFCSSVASALNYKATPTIPETILDDPAVATPLGYSRSKWVAEHICANAARATRMRHRVAVFRVGQLSGDSKNGIWNAKEAWPMMLSSVKLTGSLPRLQDEPLNWLPVDIAAEALIQGVESPDHPNIEQAAEIKVFHVLNEHQTPQWLDLLRWLKDYETKQGYNSSIIPWKPLTANETDAMTQKTSTFEQVTQLRTVSPEEWVKQLEDIAENPKYAEHPAMKLLGHWKKAYGENNEGEEGREAPAVCFALTQTKKDIPALRTVRPVDEEYFGKVWTWIRESM